MDVVVVEDVRPLARVHAKAHVIQLAKDRVIVHVVVDALVLVLVDVEDLASIRVDPIVHRGVDHHVQVTVDYLAIQDAQVLVIYHVQHNVHQHVLDHVLDNVMAPQVSINIFGENK